MEYLESISFDASELGDDYEVDYSKNTITEFTGIEDKEEKTQS